MEGWILITSLAGLDHPNIRSSGRRRSPKVRERWDVVGGGVGRIDGLLLLSKSTHIYLYAYTIVDKLTLLLLNIYIYTVYIYI